MNVCEDERMKWTGEERSAAWSGRDAVRGRREGFHGRGGEGRPDWAATETLSAAWLPPKDSASFPPPVHLAPVSPLPPPPPLSSSLPSLLLLSLPSFTLQFLPLALFFSLRSSISLTSLVFSPPPPPRPPRLGHYRHSAAGWEVGVGGCGGGMGRLRGGQKPWDAAVRREWLALKRSRTAS